LPPTIRVSLGNGGGREKIAASGAIDVLGNTCAAHPRRHHAQDDGAQLGESSTHQPDVMLQHVPLFFALFVIDGMPRERSFGSIVNIGRSNGQAGQYAPGELRRRKSGVHGSPSRTRGCGPGPQVNAIAPGYIDVRDGARVHEEVLEKIVARIPAAPPARPRGDRPRGAFGSRTRLFITGSSHIDQRRAAMYCAGG